ncbi:MAG TPA: hypothetical protein VMV57_11225, partial [Terracidiphilus sp.]|nr:hypothetical protein [Terracidiphilus sp.]
MTRHKTATAMRRLGWGVGLSSMLCAGMGWAAAAPLSKVPAPSGVGWRDVSMAEYGRDLAQLSARVDACAKGRDATSCDPALVGPDDRVPLKVKGREEQRLIRFGWLRVLMSQAEQPDKAPEKAPEKPAGKEAGKQVTPPVAGDADKADTTAPPTTSELLQAAKTRLAFDLAEATGKAQIGPQWSAERAALLQVLAGRDFRDLQGQTVRDSVMERLNSWLNRLFAGLSRWRARAAWVGFALVWGFVLAVCIGLVWGLLQLERRWRLRLIPELAGTAPGAASARDWQLWLKDAEAAAAAGRWREAIHCVYWAAISRLEQKRLWPAD